MQKAVPPSTVMRLSFEGDPDSKAFHQWREEYAERYFDMHFKPLGTELFRVAVRADALPALVIGNGTGTPQRNYSPPSGISRSSGELVLLVPRGAHLHFRQGRRALEAISGQVLLSDTSMPWQLDMAPARHLTSLAIQRNALLALVPNAEDLAAQPIPAAPSLISLLVHTLDGATAFGGELDPLGRAAISRHILDLVALVLGARGESAETARERGLAAARLESIKTYVLERLADPGLSVADVGAKHGLGVRYVQRLFELSGTTFTQFVLEQRLQAARRGLIRKDRRAQTVSQVAFECGFSDISNFNRAFRRRFGATPSDVRADALLKIGGDA